MPSIEEINALVKSKKDLKERKEEAEKIKQQKKPVVKEEKNNKQKILMNKLREEVSSIKGKDLEKEDIDGLIIKEKESEHLWNKKEEKKEIQPELIEDKKIPFREGHWHKTEQQKKENKISSLNIKLEEKPLHHEEKETEQKKQILEELKEHASGYKKINEISAPEKKLFEKGVSEKIILEKKSAEKIIKTPLPEKKKDIESEMLKEFVLEKPLKEKTKATESEKPKEKKSMFQVIESFETETPEQKIYLAPEERMKELEKIIPVNIKAMPQKEKSVEENQSVAGQLKNITGFFTKGLAKKMGAKQVDESVFNGLTKEEKNKVKKLVSSLDVAVKKYTKEEIIEALELEGHPKKIIEPVIEIIYS